MKIIPIFFYHEKWAVIMRKFVYSPDGVEKMGPLRGDGNKSRTARNKFSFLVEKMGPLRGDGNTIHITIRSVCVGREDGSPSWGRKPLPQVVQESV